MSQKVTIRKEAQADYRQVEEIIRTAFWNLYVPGCTEHYLAHTLRSHEDFIPQLDLVIELDGQVIGNILYTRTKLIEKSGLKKDILTFGPVCILPEYQRKGYGKRLMEYSFERAASLGYEAIVIFGDPNNYVSRGFQSCKKLGVSLENGSYPAAMMIKELCSGALEGKKWVYYESPAFQMDMQAAERFDEGFEKWAKKQLPCQETFYILSNAVLL